MILYILKKNGRIVLSEWSLFRSSFSNFNQPMNKHKLKVRDQTHNKMDCKSRAFIIYSIILKLFIRQLLKDTTASRPCSMFIAQNILLKC